MRNARSGGRYVELMVTVAPAAVSASTKDVRLPLNGSAQSETSAVPGKRGTHCAPLNSPAGMLTTAGVVFVVGVAACAAHPMALQLDAMIAVGFDRRAGAHHHCGLYAGDGGLLRRRARPARSISEE